MDDNSVYATPDPGSDQDESVEYNGRLNAKLFTMTEGKKEKKGHKKGESMTYPEAKQGDIKIKMESPRNGTQEMAQNRDPPTTLNSHVRVEFEDIFAEPDDIQSLNPVWRLSYVTFIITKSWCYRIITFLFATPVAIVWGLYFAVLTFLHIWFVVPCIKATVIKLQCAGQLFGILIRTFVDPLYVAFAKMFSNIHIKMSKR